MNTLVYYRGVGGLWWRTEQVAESKRCAIGVERRRPVGNEIKCAIRIGKKRSEGKVLLETSEIIFRGDASLKIPFAEMKSVHALNGDLLVRVGDELLAFEVGETAAAKWREKILHPKSRVEKLGVKSGMRVALLGSFGEDFLKELEKMKCVVNSVAITGGTELIFAAAEDSKELSLLAKCAKKMKGAMGLWVIFPKGQKEITSTGVISAGREAGLTDIKVMAFSPTHTGLKFVIPAAKLEPPEFTRGQI
jgi:hypothetical protein